MFCMLAIMVFLYLQVAGPRGVYPITNPTGPTHRMDRALHLNVYMDVPKRMYSDLQVQLSQAIHQQNPGSNSLSNFFN